MIAFNDNSEPNKPNDEGGGGALFERPDNIRSDARLAARMISLGVLPIEKAEGLLRKGFRLAWQSAQSGKAREYAACMKIAIEAAKLAQNERHKVLDKSVPDLHEISSRVSIYLPANGRERAITTNGNGHNGNGKH